MLWSCNFGIIWCYLHVVSIILKMLLFCDMSLFLEWNFWPKSISMKLMISTLLLFTRSWSHVKHLQKDNTSLKVVSKFQWKDIKASIGVFLHILLYGLQLNKLMLEPFHIVLFISSPFNCHMWILNVFVLPNYINMTHHIE